MSIIDKILERTGLKYEDLNTAERDTLNNWLETLNKGELTVQKIREYIFTMKEAVEAEVAKSNLDTKQDLYLKARLRNYMLLDAYLSTPEKAKEQIENQLAGIINK